ncbi:ABC transporter ATP-binding protein [Ornithinibacillus sp. 4-3]|uniref:ABC transporter ATP-binding protein n=1 Tax=Ornithinibacillus sp. 4-3 TaxID=3231488 RepID=A0AB39HQ04_9BACI
MKEQTELLSVENLSITFYAEGKKTISAVRDVSFNIKEGETLALVGESGCGKSVTALSVMQLLPKTDGYVEGQINLNDRNINALSEKAMRDVRGNDISMIFQEPMTSLNPVHKIGEQISEVLKIHAAVSKTELRKESINMLKKVGIPRAEKIVDEYPHQLSGGMRQRVMIAMAMACNPRLLIADEPTTALDVTIQAQILELMNELKEQYKTAILMITHDLGVVAEMADNVIVMYYGQIVEQADVRTLFKYPKHPYTIGLLNSIPNIEEEDDIRLKPIEGNVPNLGVIQQGCPFRYRCTKAHDRCETENPPLIQHGDQLVRCWLYEEEAVR